jgi:hypothetical protein
MTVEEERKAMKPICECCHQPLTRGYHGMVNCHPFADSLEDIYGKEN